VVKTIVLVATKKS